MLTANGHSGPKPSYAHVLHLALPVSPKREGVSWPAWIHSDTKIIKSLTVNLSPNSANNSPKVIAPPVSCEESLCFQRPTDRRCRRFRSRTLLAWRQVHKRSCYLLNTESSKAPWTRGRGWGDHRQMFQASATSPFDERSDGRTVGLTGGRTDGPRVQGSQRSRSLGSVQRRLELSWKRIDTVLEPSWSVLSRLGDVLESPKSIKNQSWRDIL